MNRKMRRNLPGTFATRELKEGIWRLSRREPAPVDVILGGVEIGAADAFRSPTVRDIDIEWRGDWVVVSMTCAEHRRTIKPQGAIVHEPLPRLYEVLPLVALDANARRFWRRVFRLVRIPGGRFLLGVLARRTRARR